MNRPWLWIFLLLLNPQDSHTHIFHNMKCQHFCTTTIAPHRGNESVIKTKGRWSVSSSGCQLSKHVCQPGASQETGRQWMARLSDSFMLQTPASSLNKQTKCVHESFPVSCFRVHWSASHCGDTQVTVNAKATVLMLAKLPLASWPEAASVTTLRLNGS